MAKFNPSETLQRLQDCLLASIFLIISLPIMLMISLAIKATSPGSLIYKQARQGKDGELFTIYKFRSMYPNTDKITPVGHLIRSTSMDELPQFINVLRGEMSVIGPRPHVPEENTRYSNFLENYADRHQVKPGITGWAQVSGLRGYVATKEQIAKRLEYDLYYIQHKSFCFDMKILMMTIGFGFKEKQAP